MRSVLDAVGERIGELSRTSRRALLGAAVVVPVTAAFVVVLSASDKAEAHGSLEAPASRIYYCRFAENPENPTSAACKAAIAISGKQAVYDWNEVNQPNAGGNHRAVVPDGQLCSGGRAKYRGFDLPRADWPATPMRSGTRYHFQMLGTAAHVGTVQLFITRNGYDPTQPLRWSDLEPTPFLTITGGQYPADYSATAQVPSGKSGRHVIYMIWQRTDSPEAFYACSDVDFAGDGSVPTSAHPDHTPSAGPSDHADTSGQTGPDAALPAPPPGEVHVVPDPSNEAAPDHGHDHGGQSHPQSGPSEWAAGTSYQVGALVRYGGRVYRCIQVHTSLVGWEPSATPALWTAVAGTSADGTASWQPQTAYGTGQVVSNNGRLYLCRQGHVSLTGWEPTNTPALWEPLS